MKNSEALFALFSMILLVGSIGCTYATAKPAYTNLVTNGDFETWDGSDFSGWTNYVGSWSQATGSSFVKSGSASCKADSEPGPGTHDFQMTNDVTSGIAGSTAYYFAVWFKGPSHATYWVQLRWFQDTSAKDAFAIGPFTGDDDWHEATWSGTSVSGVNNLDVIIISQSSSSSFSLYVDDVRLATESVVPEFPDIFLPAFVLAGIGLLVVVFRKSVK